MIFDDLVKLVVILYKKSDMKMNKKYIFFFLNFFRMFNYYDSIKSMIMVLIYLNKIVVM